MCAFDGLVLTSYAEAFPNVVGEAMSVKLPVIASNVGDVAHLIPDSAFMFAKGDINALADQIGLFFDWIKINVAKSVIKIERQSSSI